MTSGRRWIWMGAWAIATAALVILVARTDTTGLMGAVERADWRWIVAAIACNSLIIPLGGFEWHALIAASSSVTRRRMTKIFALTSLANNTTPSLIGHVTGVLLLGAEPGVGRAAALSVLALDQAAVGLSKCAILMTAAAVAPLPGWMRAGFATLGLALTALLAALILAARQRDSVSAWMASHPAGTWFHRLLSFVSRWTSDLGGRREPTRMFAGFLFALGIRVAEGCAILCVQRALAVDVPVTGTLLVLSATLLATFVPVAPANIGTYEAAVFAAYRHLGVAPEMAFGAALMLHACQLVPAVGIGYIALMRRPR